MSKERFIEKLVLLIIISSVFLPGVVINDFSIRVDDFLVFISFPLLFLLKSSISSSRLSIKYIGVILALVTSTFLGYCLLDVPFSIRDVNELFRLAKPFLLLVMIHYCDKEYLKIHLIRFFQYGTIFILAFAFLEFFNVLEFRRGLSFLYSSENYLYSGNYRLLLTAANPNVAAAIVLFFILYQMTSFILNRDKLIPFLLMLSLLLVLLMTSSRTILLAFLLVFGLGMLRLVKTQRLLSVVVFLVVTLFTVVLLQYFSYLSVGFETFASGSNNSMIIRYKNWEDAFELFQQSPLFGWGPAKAIHETIVDGEHFLLLRRFGLIGYSLILLLLTNGIFLFFKSKKVILEKLDLKIVYISYYSVFGVLVLMVTNNFFSGYQLMLLYVLILSLAEHKINLAVRKKNA